jgi:hypothetical protein
MELHGLNKLISNQVGQSRVDSLDVQWLWMNSSQLVSMLSILHMCLEVLAQQQAQQDQLVLLVLQVICTTERLDTHSCATATGVTSTVIATTEAGLISGATSTEAALALVTVCCWIVLSIHE